MMMTTYYIQSKTIIGNLLKRLENESSLILDWFRINEMKPNDDKCHLIVCIHDQHSVTLGKEKIETTASVELLGDSIEKKFTEDVPELDKKCNGKLHSLATIPKYLNEDKLKIIMKTFIQSPFKYCPLVWMFHNRTLNNKINRHYNGGGGGGGGRG